MTSRSSDLSTAAPKKCPPVVLVFLVSVLAAGAVSMVSFETRASPVEPRAELVDFDSADSAGELAPVVQAIDDGRGELLRENARLREDVERLEGLLADLDAGELRGLEREVLRLRSEVERCRADLSSVVARFEP